MNAHFEWINGRDPVQVWMPGYRQYIVNLFQAVEDLLESHRDEIEGWMKANHVWKNRTRLAEDSLLVKVVYDNLRFILIMAHGRDVRYSRFLEGATGTGYMRGGYFGVLLPTLDYWSPLLLAELKKMLK